MNNEERLQELKERLIKIKRQKEVGLTDRKVKKSRKTSSLNALKMTNPSLFADIDAILKEAKQKGGDTK